MRNLDGPLLPFGFSTYRPAPPADTGMEAVIHGTRLSFIPQSYVGTGLVTGAPPNVQSGGVLAINRSLVSGLPGVLVPSMRTQPLSPSYPTG